MQWLSTPTGRVLVALVAFVYATVALSTGPAFAQTGGTGSQSSALAADYRVGPGDYIYVSVPQRPDLNRQLAVANDGTINLPLVGNVQVRGLNKVEIETKLLQSLREYYPSVNKVEITIRQALSNVIFVSGEVRFPGKYSFPQDVNVWEAVREAGGPVPSANLSSVRVVQDRARGGTSSIVDIQAALDNGTVDNLPMLKPGDTIIIPGQEEGYTGSAGVNVTGAVNRPGNYRLTGRQDVMSAILMAGGPSERGNMSKVRLIRPDNDGRAETYKLNVKDFLEEGKMDSNPKLKPGDTIEVASKGFTGRDMSLVLSFVTAIGTIVLLYYSIQDEASNSN